MANKKKFDFNFKILMIGDNGVGKSDIINRYIKKNFIQIHPSSMGKLILYII